MENKENKTVASLEEMKAKMIADKLEKKKAREEKSKQKAVKEMATVALNKAKSVDLDKVVDKTADMSKKAATEAKKAIDTGYAVFLRKAEEISSKVVNTKEKMSPRRKWQLIIMLVVGIALLALGGFDWVTFFRNFKDMHLQMFSTEGFGIFNTANWGGGGNPEPGMQFASVGIGIPTALIALLAYLAFITVGYARVFGSTPLRNYIKGLAIMNAIENPKMHRFDAEKIIIGKVRQTEMYQKIMRTPIKNVFMNDNFLRSLYAELVDFELRDIIESIGESTAVIKMAGDKVVVSNETSTVTVDAIKTPEQPKEEPVEVVEVKQEEQPQGKRFYQRF